MLAELIRLEDEAEQARLRMLSAQEDYKERRHRADALAVDIARALSEGVYSVDGHSHLVARVYKPSFGLERTVTIEQVLTVPESSQ